MTTASFMSEINPGIRATVEWLRKRDFNTCDSGDGETHDFECDLSIPYVYMIVDPATILISETDRLAFLLESEKGIKLQPMDEELSGKPTIQANYNPQDGVATICLFNVKL
jgi:hypothetical protein